jgi:hypothetical protein
MMMIIIIIVKMDVGVEWSTILFRGRGIPRKNLCPETGYPEVFRGSSQFLQANAGIVP